jgi:superfamily I DNA/RNA helicase
LGSVDNQYRPEDRSRAFVDHRSGTLVALAGPGTGKTYSLILRIQELVQSRHVPATDICYLTFIKGVTLAFRADLKIKYPAPQEVERLRINTVHSLALRIIRNTGPSVGLAGPLHMMDFADDADPLAFLAQDDMISLLTSSNNLHSRPDLRSSIHDIKGDWQNGRSLVGLTGDKGLLSNSYSQYSRAFRTLDWDELIPISRGLYSNNGNTPDWLNSLKHILIDEYQDFNASEQAFLSAICSNSTSTVIVGDPDQSIYRWRGASPAGIQSQASDPNNTSVSLVTCRRCRERIVDAANRFLGFMNANPRLLQPHQPNGVFSLKSFKSCKAEADYLANRLTAILAGIGQETVAEERPICLFSSKRVLGQYKTELEKRGVRCTMRDVQDTLDEKAWLRLCARVAIQRDQPFLHRVLLERFPNLRRRAQEIVDLVVGGCPSVRNAIGLLAERPQWGKESQSAAQSYSLFLDQLTSRNPDLVLAAFNSVLTGSNQCTRVIVDTFLNAADEVDLEDYIDELSSQVFGAATTGVPYQAEIELLSMHSSKGLTRRWVFLPGFEEAWMPHNATGAKLEECKRLFFVAITRATDEVCITYPRSRARKDILNFPIAGKGRRSSFTDHLNITQEWL